MAIVRIKAKLAGMRKEQEFIVYPSKGSSEPVIVQSDRAIGMFDRATGRGRLNWRGGNSKYFVHLNKALGAEDYQFPDDFRLTCLEMMPNSGDLIGSSPITGPVYIA